MQVLTFFVHHFMYDNKKSESGSDQYLFPRDVSSIPEFTVVNMHMMTSNNDTEGGYGIKLKRIELHPTSLYSYMGAESLQQLPGTYDKASELAVERARDNQFIHNQFEGTNVAFYAKVPVNSFISSVPVVEGFYRIVGSNGGELFPGVLCVDVSKEDLFKFSNSVAEDQQDRVLDAITLLDFSSCASSLWMYVVCVSSYKTGDPMLSDFRGVPLVDVDGFLASVDFDREVDPSWVSGDKIVFPFRHEIVSLESSSVVTVYKEPVVSGGSGDSGISSSPPLFPVPCPDFSLVSEASPVVKGYLVTIGTRKIPDILRVVLNVMGCTFLPGGAPVRMDYMDRVKRRRIGDKVDKIDNGDKIESVDGKPDATFDGNSAAGDETPGFG